MQHDTFPHYAKTTLCWASPLGLCLPFLPLSPSPPSTTLSYLLLIDTFRQQASSHDCKILFRNFLPFFRTLSFLCETLLHSKILDFKLFQGKYLWLDIPFLCVLVSASILHKMRVFKKSGCRMNVWLIPLCSSLLLTQFAKASEATLCCPHRPTLS